MNHFVPIGTVASQEFERAPCRHENRVPSDSDAPLMNVRAENTVPCKAIMPQNSQLATAGAAPRFVGIGEDVLEQRERGLEP